MRSVLLALAALIVGPNFSSAMGPAAPLQFVGTYSVFRQTPEHAYGYALTLWVDEGIAHALWTRAQGEPADFPMVAVTDLSWDQVSGAIRFTARWCDGIESFRGTLGSDLRGTLDIDNHSEELTLKRGDVAEMQPRLPAEWKAFVAEELNRRQPKC